MRVSLRRSIARLRAGGNLCGTAWVIAPGVAVTAWHCLTKAEEKQPGSPLELTAEFPGINSVKLVWTDADRHPTIDMVLLRPAVGTELPSPLKLVRRPREERPPGGEWWTHGHPAILRQNQRGSTWTGTILNLDSDYNGNPAIELSATEVNVKGGTSKLGGLSGAPIFVYSQDHRVVGTVFWSPPVSADQRQLSTPIDAAFDDFLAELDGIDLVPWSDAYSLSIYDLEELRHEPGGSRALFLSRVHTAYRKTLVQRESRESRLESGESLTTTPRPPFHGLPSLPPYYQSRHTPITEIKHRLLQAQQSQSGLILGLSGMAGSGKSTLANAVARDAEIQKHFPDGVYWLSVGRSPNISQLQAEIALETSDVTLEEAEESSAKQTLEALLRELRLLIILDDVWVADHATSLIATSPRSCTVLTTRNREMLVAIGASEFAVPIFSKEESMALLSRSSAGVETAPLPREAFEIAQECGHLPLALALIGSSMRLRPKSWSVALARLRRADLASIKQTVHGYPHPDLARAMGIGIDALSVPDQERYYDLSALPRGPIPQGVLSVLWDLSSADTYDCVTRFISHSLAFLEGAANAESLRLHDLQYDNIQQNRSGPQQALHMRILDAWDRLRVEEPRYAWRWINFHRFAAGRIDLIEADLFDFAWIMQKIEHAGVRHLIGEYNYISHLPAASIVQSALMLSAFALTLQPWQLGGQLLGRLIGMPEPEIQRLLSGIMQFRTKAWIRPMSRSLEAAGGALIGTIGGYPDQYTSVATTKDGIHGLSTSNGGAIRIWNLLTGDLVDSFASHLSAITAVALQDDGIRAIFGGGDGVCEVWDLMRHRPLLSVRLGLAKTTAVASAPCGTKAASTDESGNICIWNAITGAIDRTWTTEGRPLSAVFTPDGGKIIVALQDGNVEVWTIDGEMRHRLQCVGVQEEELIATAVTPDGKTLVSSSAQGVLNRWDLRTGSLLGVIEIPPERDMTVGAALTKDGQTVVTLGLRQELNSWRTDNGEQVQSASFSTNMDGVTAVAVTNDGRRAISAYESGVLRIWDVQQKGDALDRYFGPHRCHYTRVDSVAFRRSQSLCIAADLKGTFTIWQSGNGERKSKESLFKYDYDKSDLGMSITGDGKFIASYGISAEETPSWDRDCGRQLRIWTLSDPEALFTIQSRGLFSALTTDAESSCFLAGKKSGVIELWNPAERRRVKRFFSRRSRVILLALSMSARRAAATNAKNLSIWSTEDSALIAQGSLPAGPTALIFADQARKIVIGTECGDLHVLDCITGATLRVLFGHTTKVSALCATVDGMWVVSGSRDRISIWRASTWESVAMFTIDDGVTALAIDWDTKRIIVGDYSGVVHIFEVANADQL